MTIDWEARYLRLAAAAVETRERCANFSGCRLTDFQRGVLLTVVEPLSKALQAVDDEQAAA